MSEETQGSATASSFHSMGVKDWILDQLSGLGVKKPTPVQQNCIPAILEGRDVMGVAKTGEGKTLAFAIPILQKLSDDPYGIFALVLTPTRELALQIGETFNSVGKPLGLRLEVVVGGRDTIRQSKDLERRPHVIIATPGRLADHIETNPTFNLNKVRFLVLDEADRLLEGNFDGQLSVIIPSLPVARQTMLFTATASPAVATTISVCPNNPLTWEDPSIASDNATVASLDQRFLLSPKEAVDSYLVQLLLSTLASDPSSQTMVFCKTCKTTELLGRLLARVKISVSTLHSMKPQRERVSSLATFKSRQTKVLVATDVASRGLDIPQVGLVVNHSVPSAPVDYVHRVGRTARAGKGGRAVSLVTPTDVTRIKEIELYTGAQMKEMELDEDEKVALIMVQVNTIKREEGIKMEEQDWGLNREINKRKKAILKGEDFEFNKKRKKQKS